MTAETLTRRGTTNGNARGNTQDRRARRAFIMTTYASNVPGYCRCYRCGTFLFNPDDWNMGPGSPPLTRVSKLAPDGTIGEAFPLTVDRIIPGCKGGTYRRNNIRPACGGCNSETGGPLAGQGKRK